MARFANLESAEDQLTEAGLPVTVVDDLLAEAREALLFTRTLTNDASVAPGVSKLGGLPDLPPGMPWPKRQAYSDTATMIERVTEMHGPAGYVPNAELLQFYIAHWTSAAPLSFLGQIDLEAMAQIAPFEAGIARSGRLLIFADLASFSSGATAFDAGWLSVSVIPDGPLERAAPPPALREAETTFFRLDRYAGPPDHAQCEVLDGIPAVSLPLRPQAQPLSVVRVLNELDMADFTPLMGALGGEGVAVMFTDQLGGYPVPIQNDVFNDLFTSAEPILRPVTLPETQGQWDPQRWVHLLSIGGESYLQDFPSSWGDGDLYIAHRPDPAQPGALGQVWAIGQQT